MMTSAQKIKQLTPLNLNQQLSLGFDIEYISSQRYSRMMPQGITQYESSTIATTTNREISVSKNKIPGTRNEMVQNTDDAKKNIIVYQKYLDIIHVRVNAAP